MILSGDSHKNIFALFIGVLLINYSQSTAAGDIHLNSELWPFICKVEIAVGLNAWENPTYTKEFEGVEKGPVYTGTDRLCYRRSSTPDDCYSPLNQWTCQTNPTPKPDTMELY
jgi:hypothetical protein